MRSRASRCGGAWQFPVAAAVALCVGGQLGCEEASEGDGGFGVIDAGSTPTDTGAAAEEPEAPAPWLRATVLSAEGDSFAFDARLGLKCRVDALGQRWISGADIRGGAALTLSLRLGVAQAPAEDAADLGPELVWPIVSADDGADAPKGEARLSWLVEGPEGLSRGFDQFEGEVRLDPDAPCAGTFWARFDLQGPSGEVEPLELDDGSFGLPLGE